ncbi:MAG: glycosyltransferase family 2 protein [Hyphomicrobiaceae bacterium]
MRNAARQPDVSFIMAAHNASEHIVEALESALSQDDVDVEVIVADDCSSDDTREKVRARAASSGGVRLVELARQRGPSAARNAALEVARGQWLAILDADDVLFPCRSRRLIELATSRDADLVADNLISFAGDTPEPIAAVSDAFAAKVGLDQWLDHNPMIGGDFNLGFVKPMIRASFAIQNGLSYDPRQRVGEDYLMVLSALRQGADFVITTEPMYCYRQQDGSLSSSWEEDEIRQLGRAQREILGELIGEAAQETMSALARHERSIDTAASYERLKRSIKSREWQDAVGVLRERPRLMLTILELAARRVRRIGNRGATAHPLIPNRVLATLRRS